jgi:hypothetical protein
MPYATPIIDIAKNGVISVNKSNEWVIKRRTPAIGSKEPRRPILSIMIPKIGEQMADMISGTAMTVMRIMCGEER